MVKLGLKRWGELEGNEREATGHSQTLLANWNHLESFSGKKPRCPVSLRLIGISEGGRRHRNFDSFPGLYQGSDV